MRSVGSPITGERKTRKEQNRKKGKEFTRRFLTTSILCSSVWFIFSLL